MIILLASQKGGPGKSTAAVNLATELARTGSDVVLVDADRQRSAARWAQDRSDGDYTPAVPCVEKLGNIRSTLAELNSRYGVVIVDAAGHDSQEARTALTIADVVVVPVRPSQLDLDTLEPLGEVITEARDFNPGLVVMGLLSQVPTNANGSEATDAREYLSDYPLYEPLGTVLHERKAFRDTIGEGLSVVEWTNPKAKAEVSVLAAEITERMSK